MGFASTLVHFLCRRQIEKANQELKARLEEITLLYERTRELSVRDELTQLYNRRHFQQVLPLEIKRSGRFNRPLSLLMIDIDHFKAYNDRYGHPAGDERLKEFVHLVASRTREVDFFARYGGEEFVLILPDADRRDGTRVAEKILTLVRDHRFSTAAGAQGSVVPPVVQRMTVSIGVASYPEDAGSMEDLIDAADCALYEAKRGGRDRVAVHQPPSIPPSLSEVQPPDLREVTVGQVGEIGRVKSS